jgi:hypothetical protein
MLAAHAKVVSLGASMMIGSGNALERQDQS